MIQVKENTNTKGLQEIISTEEIEKFHRKICQGIDDMENGRGRKASEVIAKLKEKCSYK